MLYISLEDFYRINMQMKLNLQFNIQEIEQLYPYERDFYILISKEMAEKEAKDNEAIQI